MQPLNALVVGAGAVGLGVASCLLHSGQRVRFVTPPAGRAALGRAGLLRTGIFGELRFPPEAFGLSASLAELPPEPFDYVLVCTKSNASRDVAEAIAAAVGRIPEAAGIVLFQNGWGNAEVFAERMTPARVFNARVITGFRRPAPNEVEITVHAEAIRIGSLYGAPAAAVEPLCRAIDAGGVPCRVADAIEKDLWAKMLYNCALNPLGALLEVPYGALAGSEPARRILRAVVTEIFAVLEASGHRTHWDGAEAYLEEFYAEILPPTARHESSMLQDLRSGRRSEVDALNGAVVALGERHAVGTPVNQALVQLIRAIEVQPGVGPVAAEG